MRQIDAKARSIDDLLSKQSYQIDYYQREYRWEEKQVDELVDYLLSLQPEDGCPPRPPVGGDAATPVTQDAAPWPTSLPSHPTSSSPRARAAPNAVFRLPDEPSAR